MTSFFLTSSSQTARSLAAGDSGFVNQGAALFTPAGTAVSVTGDATLVAMGTIAANAAHAVQLGAAVESFGLTVGAQGTLLSTTDRALSGSVADELFLNNAGLISGSTRAISLSAPARSTGSPDFQITNTGTISSNSTSLSDPTIFLTFASGGTVEFANAGTILNGGNSSVIEIVGATLSLGNSGTIQGSDGTAAIIGGTGPDVVENTGQIIGRIVLGTGSDRVVNHGSVIGNISLSGGSDRLFNSGRITGQVDLGESASSDPMSDRVVNSGIIDGDVLTGSGNDVFISRGGTVTGAVYGGTGDDLYYLDSSSLRIVDTGGLDTIISTVNYTLGSGIEGLTLQGAAGLRGDGNALGNTMLGDEGDDTLFGRGGNDDLLAGNGDDVLYGGAGNDQIGGGDGDDRMYGGIGDDAFHFGQGDVTVDGGAGRDTVSLALQPTTAATVNLHSGKGGSAEGYVWTFAGIEDIAGSGGNDTLTGSTGDNRIGGRFGNDSLLGIAGNDTLVGGAGSDTLSGGAGDDVFLFEQIQDSTAGAADLITDFVRNRDRIDLSAIQAETTGDGAFAFLGTGAFTGSADGQLRYQTDSVTNTTLIEIRLGGSTANDMEILLTGQITLRAIDFLL